MRRSRITLIGLALTTCRSGGALPITIQPAPSSASTEANPPFLRGPWAFSTRKEAHTYHSISRVVLQLGSKTEHNEDTLSVSTQFILKIDQSHRPTIISGYTDGFSISSSSRIGIDSQLINTPISFVGKIDSGKIVLDLESAFTAHEIENYPCYTQATSILGEIRTGITLLPPYLSADSVWSDTITTTICSGKNIPSTLETIRSYRVIRETTYAGLATLLIQRTEATRLLGDGTQGQHLIKVEATGTGISNIYIDQTTGIPLTIEAQQELHGIISSSGQLQSFLQKVDQRISLTH